MSKKALILSFMILAVSLSYFSCGSSGCPEGQREYMGKCIPEDSDGDQSPVDGDEQIIVPDGDKDNTADGDVTPDGDQEQNETDNDMETEDDADLPVIQGNGNCSNPFVLNLGAGELYNSELKLLSGFSNTVNASVCLGGEDGDSEEDVLGRGVEVVIKAYLEVGQSLTVQFMGTEVDSLIYALVAKCSLASTCASEVVNMFGEGEAETMVFKPDVQGEYFIIMDTNSPYPTGNYTFSATLTEDSVDGDDDNEDDEMDADSDNAEEDEEDSILVPQCQFYSSTINPIPIDYNVTGAMTDLHWEGMTLYLTNDYGTGVWPATSIDQGKPVMSSEAVFEVHNHPIRGISYNDTEAFLYYLDKQGKTIIEKRSSGDVELNLISDFGSEASGLTVHDGILYAVDSTDKLFKITVSEGSVSMQYVQVQGATSLVGITSSGTRLLLLDIVGLTSKIHDFNLGTNTIQYTYIRENVPFSGISYCQYDQKLWATHATTRQAVTLIAQNPCPGWN